MKPSLTVLRTGLSSLVCASLLAACGPGFKSKQFTDAERDAYFKANPQFAHLDKRSKAKSENKGDDQAKVEQGPAQQAPAETKVAEENKDAAQGKSLTEEKPAAPAEDTQTSSTKTFLAESEALLKQKISEDQSIIKGFRPTIVPGSSTVSVTLEAVVDINGTGEGAYLYVSAAADGQSVFFNFENGKLELPLSIKDANQNPLISLQSGITASVACKVENCGEIVLRVDFANKQSAVFVLGDQTRVKEGFLVDTNLDLKKSFEEAQTLVPAAKMKLDFEPADQPVSEVPAKAAPAEAPVQGETTVPAAPAVTEELPAAKTEATAPATAAKSDLAKRPEPVMKIELGPNGQPVRKEQQEPMEPVSGPRITTFKDGKPSKVIEYDVNGKIKEDKPTEVPPASPQSDLQLAPPAVDLTGVNEVFEEAETGIPVAIAAPQADDTTMENSPMVSRSAVGFNGSIVSEVDNSKEVEMALMEKAKRQEQAFHQSSARTQTAAKAGSVGQNGAIVGQADAEKEKYAKALEAAKAQETAMHRSGKPASNVAKKNTAKTR